MDRLVKISLCVAAFGNRPGAMPNTWTTARRARTCAGGGGLGDTAIFQYRGLIIAGGAPHGRRWIAPACRQHASHETGLGKKYSHCRKILIVMRGSANMLMPTGSFVLRLGMALQRIIALK
jgi:hypothetical protein